MSYTATVRAPGAPGAYIARYHHDQYKDAENHARAAYCHATRPGLSVELACGEVVVNQLTLAELQEGAMPVEWP